MLPIANKKLHGRFTGNENRNFNAHGWIDQPDRANAISRPFRAYNGACGGWTKFHRAVRPETLAHPNPIHFPKAQFHSEPIDHRVERRFNFTGIRLSKPELQWVQWF